MLLAHLCAKSRRITSSVFYAVASGRTAGQIVRVAMCCCTAIQNRRRRTSDVMLLDHQVPGYTRFLGALGNPTFLVAPPVRPPDSRREGDGAGNHPVKAFMGSLKLRAVRCGAWGPEGLTWRSLEAFAG